MELLNMQKLTAATIKDVLKEFAPAWKLHRLTNARTNDVWYRHKCGAVVKTASFHQEMYRLRNGKPFRRCECEGRPKRGPYNVNYAGNFKRRLKRNRPDYTLISEYTKTVDVHTFKHRCGQTFEAIADNVVTGAAKCPCEHSKVVRHTVETVEDKLRDTEWSLQLFFNHEHLQLTHNHCGASSVFTARHFFSGPGGQRVCKHCCGETGSATSIPEVKAALTDEYKYRGFFVSKKTGRYRYKLTHAAESCGHKFSATWEQIKQRKTTCPLCQKGWRNFEYGSHKFRVQGVEDLALTYLIETKGIDPNRVVGHGQGRAASKLPFFEYDFMGKKHKYFPDFWIPDLNLIVEVKDPSSLGLYTSYSGWFHRALRRNKAKSKAVLAAGYKFQMLVFDRGSGRVVLPKDWLDMSRKQLLSNLA